MCRFLTGLDLNKINVVHWSCFRNCEGNLPGIPLHLRNATTKLNKDLGYAKGYSYDLSQVQKLQYMPEGMEKVNFFESK